MIHLLLMIALIGIVAGILVQYVPMPDPMKKIIIAVAAVGAVLLAVQGLGGHAP